MRFYNLIMLFIAGAFSSAFCQNINGNYWINGRLNVEYATSSQLSATQMDNETSFGGQGIGALNAGDFHLRGYWGVVIDKNGGNYGESAAYNNGVLPAGGSFAVRTRISTTAFRTDFIIRNNGNTGFGINNPDEKLVVNGNMRLSTSGGKFYWDWPSRCIEQISPDNGISKVIRFRNSMTSPAGNPNGGFDFADENGNSILRIKENNVGIGTILTTNPNNYKLAVKGKIGAQEIQVENTSSTWADYVFKADYQLMPLSQVEKFVQQNNHLPEIPTAEEIKRDGHKLGEMDVLLLKKVEELTLHLIQHEKEINELKAELSSLRDKVGSK